MNPPEFKLTPKTNQINSSFAAEVLTTIQMEERDRTRKRPVLLAWTSRMPVGIHRQLKKAAKVNNVSMTSIQIEALRRLLPSLLAPQELKAAALEAEQDSDLDGV